MRLRPRKHKAINTILTIFLLIFNTSLNEKIYILESKENILELDTSKNFQIVLSSSKIFYKQPQSPSSSLKSFQIPDSEKLNLSSTSSISCFNIADICIICSLQKCFSVLISNNEMQFQKEFKHNEKKVFFNALTLENTDYFFTAEQEKISRWTLESENCHRSVSTGNEHFITSNDEVNLKRAPYTKNLLYTVQKYDYLRVYNILDLSLLKTTDLATLGPDFVKEIFSMDIFSDKPYENKAIICSLNSFCGVFDYGTAQISGGTNYNQKDKNKFVFVNVFHDSKYFSIIDDSNKVIIYDSETFALLFIKETSLTGEDLIQHSMIKEGTEGILISTKLHAFLFKTPLVPTDETKYCFEGCDETNLCNYYYQKTSCNGCASGYTESNLGCQKNNIESSKGAKKVLGGLSLPSDPLNFEAEAGDGGKCYTEPTPESEPQSEPKSSSSNTTEPEPIPPVQNTTEPFIEPLPLPENPSESSNFLIYGIMIGCFLIMLIIISLYLKYKKKPDVIRRNMNQENREKYFESDEHTDEQNPKESQNPFNFSHDPPVVRRITRPEGEFIESTGLRAFKLSVHGKKKKKKMNFKQTPNKMRRPYIHHDSAESDKNKLSMHVENRFGVREHNFDSPDPIKKKKSLSFGSSDSEDKSSSRSSEGKPGSEEEKRVEENEDGSSFEEISDDLGFEENSQNDNRGDIPNIIRERTDEYDFDESDFI